MELINFIVFSFCLTFVFGSPLRLDVNLEDSVDANNYIDGIIKNMKDSPKFASLPIPSYNMTNEFTIFGYELYSQEVQLTEGHLHDVQTISRVGNAIVDYRQVNFDVEVKFFFESLKSHYHFSWLLFHLGPSGLADVHLKKVYVTVRLFADLDLAHVDLTEFRLTSTEPTDIKVHISWLIDWILNPLINNYYGNKLLPFAEATIKTKLNEYIDQLNGPESNTTEAFSFASL